ncbi:uncharacterized protein LOC102803278, partial [Saccoglossus kowalevskii]|uniref:Protein cfxQ homolog n=1 Tax=Saccoglossus kowalevskii TaxID=10224 RepID=A0ABM0MTY2_SACKO
PISNTSLKPKLPEIKYISELPPCLTPHEKFGSTSKDNRGKLKKLEKSIVLNMENKLKQFVGLGVLKSAMIDFSKTAYMQVKHGDMDFRVPHMLFVGGPELLSDLGLIDQNKVIEVQRSDLVGAYIGESAIKTKEVINKSKGGILFVDEAYRLVVEGCEKDHGKEALEEIMSVMEDGDPIIILAGYEKEMNKVFMANRGLRSRVSLVFNFPNYSKEEIAEIIILEVDNDKKITTKLTVQELEQMISTRASDEFLAERNGRFSRQVFIEAKAAMYIRLFDNESSEVILSLEKEDFEKSIDKIVSMCS